MANLRFPRALPGDGDLIWLWQSSPHVAECYAALAAGVAGELLRARMTDRAYRARAKKEATTAISPWG